MLSTKRELERGKGTCEVDCGYRPPSSELVSDSAISLEPFFQHLTNQHGSSFVVDLLGNKHSPRRVAAVEPLV